MDKIIIKDFLLKYWKHILIAVLIVLLFNECNRLDTALADAKDSKAKAKYYLLQARFIKNEMNKRQVAYLFKISELEKANDKNEVLLVNLTKKVNVKISEIKRYNTSDIANYYKDRYLLKNNIETLKNAIILKDTVSRLVISDLVVGDGAKAEVKILRNVVSNEKIKFILASTEIDSLRLGLESVSKNYELANTEKDNALKLTEKAYKRERNKKNIWKITTLATVVGAGYLLIK